MPKRLDIWSTSVAEISGDPLFPTHEREVLSLIARPLEWKRAHIYTYADPFMLVSCDRLWLFVERQSRGSKGVICAYSTIDKEAWDDHGVVLDEPYHISYPQVIECNGSYWMLPEVVKSGAVWLYRAQQLPGPWMKHAMLLNAPLADPTLLQDHNATYLWGTDLSGALRLYTAEKIEGPYIEHPSSPITSDARYARCGGRPNRLSDGMKVRLAQDGAVSYGRALHAMRLVELTPTTYKEILWRENIIASRQKWNVAGRHHLELAEYRGSVLRAIDGRRPEHFFNMPVRLFWRAFIKAADFIGRFK